MTVVKFWEAARTFRAPPDAEAKHKARVALLELALYENGPVKRRAADLLRQDGIAIAKPINENEKSA